jgi:hypothetical protein
MMKRVFLRVLLVVIGLLALLVLVFETVGPSANTDADTDAAAFNSSVRAAMMSKAKSSFSLYG